MKELSIEKKAKAYDKALVIAKSRYSTENEESVRICLELMFPELQENEDEILRKELMQYLKDYPNLPNGNYCRNDFFAWLEEQGEHIKFLKSIQIGDKVTRNEDGVLVNLSQLNRVAKKDENQGEQKPDDKAETKFKIEKGKWYVCIRDLYDNYANKAFCEGDTYLSTQYGNLIPCNSNVPYKVVCPDTYFRDWSIADAKAGDVLSNEKMIVIFKHFEKPSYRQHIVAYIGLDTCGNIQITDGTWILDIDKAKPATKEQRDLLFQKMKDAGYEWDAEKKELKKIEQKPTWSEEDEKILNQIQDHLREYRVDKKGYPYVAKPDSPEMIEMNWLSSIKDRVQPQPKQEWSEYDKIQLNEAIQMIEANGTWIRSEDAVKKVSNWLKSLSPNHWKPSEKQMDALKEAVDEHFDIDGGALWHLYEDLKKLREE